MAIRNRRFLALAGGVGACAVALGQGCSTTPTNDGSGGEGGDGGSSTGGKATGGSSTGGSGDGGSTGGAATGGSNNGGGGMGGMGGTVCGAETWLDDTTDSCESCEPVADHVHLCEDFVDTTSDETAQNPKTQWDAASQTFTLQIANGLPRVASATLEINWYCNDATCPTVNDTVTGVVAGDTIKFDLSDYDGDVNMIGGTFLNVTDDCGVETADIDDIWFYESSEVFYVGCE